ncbi:MAG: hypothetical protein CM1200mP4_1800 [Rhodospirillaceae bacterium]|nr:MAG: hypothetical protein CM1200mP4_1800 [Rhodospirillaceae bacterium]
MAAAWVPAERIFIMTILSDSDLRRQRLSFQELYLGGRKGAAIGAVPDELVDKVALVGSKDRVRDRLGAWRDGGQEKARWYNGCPRF